MNACIGTVTRSSVRGINSWVKQQRGLLWTSDVSRLGSASMRYRKSCPRVPLWTCTEGVAFEMNLRGISRVAMERDEKCYFRHSMNKANICKIQRMFEQRGSV